MPKTESTDRKCIEGKQYGSDRDQAIWASRTGNYDPSEDDQNNAETHRAYILL